MSYAMVGLLAFIVMVGSCSVVAKVRSKGYAS